MTAPSRTAIQRDFFTALAFPLWWYTDGLSDIVEWMRVSLRVEWRALGIGLWMKSFFRPMYGVTDLSGRAISIITRFFVILARFLWWMAHVFVYGGVLAIWCAWIPCALALFFV